MRILLSHTVEATYVFCIRSFGGSEIYHEETLKGVLLPKYAPERPARTEFSQGNLLILVKLPLEQVLPLRTRSNLLICGIAGRYGYLSSLKLARVGDQDRIRRELS